MKLSCFYVKGCSDSHIEPTVFSKGSGCRIINHPKSQVKNDFFLFIKTFSHYDFHNKIHWFHNNNITKYSSQNHIDHACFCKSPVFNVSRRYIILRFQYKGYFIKSYILVSYYDKE